MLSTFGYVLNSRALLLNSKISGIWEISCSQCISSHSASVRGRLSQSRWESPERLREGGGSGVWSEGAHRDISQVAEHKQRQLPPGPWHRGNRKRKGRGPQAREEVQGSRHGGAVILNLTDWCSHKSWGSWRCSKMPRPDILGGADSEKVGQVPWAQGGKGVIFLGSQSYSEPRVSNPDSDIRTNIIPLHSAASQERSPHCSSSFVYTSLSVSLIVGFSYLYRVDITFKNTSWYCYI